MKVDLKGVHKVRAKLASGEERIYFYAWRGGPRINDESGRPLLDPSAPAFRAAFDRLKVRGVPETGDLTIKGLIAKFLTTSEWLKLSNSSKRNYLMMLKRIEDKFGTLPVTALASPKARGKFLEWRDTLASKPRTADYAWMVLGRLLSVSKDRGLVAVNPCERGGRLYDHTRVDRLWDEESLRKLFAVCSPEIYDAVILALWTGQRQGDLLRLTWSAYDGNYIRLRQSKSGERRSVVIPVGPTLKTCLDGIPRIGSLQILNSSERHPWTSDGFRTSFFRYVAKAGIKDLTFHDLRGTAVTRLAIADCTPQQIATITGHSMRDVTTILDRHYLSRDVRLAEEAIAKLERSSSGSPAAVRPQKIVRREFSHEPATTIYFMGCGDFVKIGRANDPSARAATLATGSPHDQRVLLTLEGTKGTERELHRQFGAYHHRGEWFRLEGELLTFIEEQAENRIVKGPVK